VPRDTIVAHNWDQELMTAKLVIMTQEALPFATLSAVRDALEARRVPGIRVETVFCKIYAAVNLP
jgi:hypothetical protein